MPHLISGVWLLTLLSTSLLIAQTPIEFGRISDADRELMVCPTDSSAEAYVLYDHRDLDFAYRESEGASLLETNHRRLKLIKPSAFGRGDVVLRYWSESQQIEDLQAAIHLPAGGTILLRPEQIVRQQESDKLSSVRFTFPQLAPGATIEYRYVLRSRSILIPTPYTFQEDIPVRYAEFTAMIPAYYDYVSLAPSERFDVKETEIVKREWGPVFGVTAYKNRPELEHTRLRWGMRDLAAFRAQPYTNNLTDYLPRVRLQLRSIQYPTGGKNTLFSTWEETAADLQSRKDFGRYYRNRSNYNQLGSAAEEVLAAAATPREKVEAAYRFIIEHYDWNGQYRILASDSPDQTLKRGGGNSADLNIALLSLLNEANIVAHPLLVSLRDEGSPVEVYPLLDQFDHLMVYTELDGQPLLLDANDPDRPVGLPRVAALNHRGWVADRDNPRWIDLRVPSSNQTVMADLKVAADGLTTATLRTRMERYFAFEARSGLRSSTSPQEAPLTSVILQQYPGGSVVEAESAAETEGTTDYLNLNLTLQLPAGQPLNDYLYINPVLLPALDSKLTDVETRQYPIDFAYPWLRRYIATVHLPEGYEIDELPPSQRLRSDDGSITATYVVQHQPQQNTIGVNFTVQLDRTLFAAAEYPALREMFGRVIDLQQRPIVLKRRAK